MPGRVLGASVIERHAMQIGTSLAAAKFGAQWFADGAHPSGLLVNQSDITKEQADTVKARWLSLFRGTREPAVLGKGWDWKPLQVNPASRSSWRRSGSPRRSAPASSARRSPRRSATKPVAR